LGNKKPSVDKPNFFGKLNIPFFDANNKKAKKLLPIKKQDKD
jgi:hypothetical protein